MDPEGNQYQPLYSVHTLQKRQVQSDVQQGTVKRTSFFNELAGFIEL